MLNLQNSLLKPSSDLLKFYSMIRTFEFPERRNGCGFNLIAWGYQNRSYLLQPVDKSSDSSFRPSSHSFKKTHCKIGQTVVRNVVP